jgi:hypothetical protein
MKYRLLYTMLVLSSGLMAQNKNLDTIEVNVITKYKPLINDAAKLNSNPSIADTINVNRKVEYSFLNQPYTNINYVPDTIKPAPVKNELQERLYHSIASIGTGNYNTLYAEYFFNCLRSREWDYGIHLNHLSSDATLEGANSNYSFNDINLFGKAFYEHSILTAQADFDNHSLHDYGYSNPFENPLPPPTLQNFNLVDGKLDYQSHYRDTNHTAEDVSMGYYNFSDIFNTSENNADVKGSLSGNIHNQKYDIDASFNYYSDETRAGNTHAALVGLSPLFLETQESWDAKIGIGVNLDAVHSRTFAYPDIKIRYHIAKDVMVIYGGIDGNVTYNSYKSLSTENPYVQDTLNLQYTQTVYHLFGGVTGTITSHITYNASVSQSEIKNLPLYFTDWLEPYENRFEVVYDNVNELNLHGDIAYQYSEDLNFSASGDYFHYNTTNQLEAWYHPALKLNIMGNYNINVKCLIKVGVIIVSSQYAPVVTGEMLAQGPVPSLYFPVIAAKTLAGYPDLNAGVEYKFNKFFSAFINLNNLANVSYYRWLNYPTQRFNFLAGLRLGF